MEPPYDIMAVDPLRHSTTVCPIIVISVPRLSCLRGTKIYERAGRWSASRSHRVPVAALDSVAVSAGKRARFADTQALGYARANAAALAKDPRLCILDRSCRL